MVKKAACLLGILVIALAVVGCKRHDAAVNRPNIIILLVDAMRADGLGIYGQKGPTSPYLDEYSKRGIIFEHAFTNATHTRLSIASLFTGLLPPTHGLRRASSWNAKVADPSKETLNPELITMSEFFRVHGYRTCAVLTNPQISTKYGFNQGFDDFRYLGKSRPLEVTAEKLNAAALGWLDQNKEGPFFIYVHYIDVHAPYRPPAEYQAMFTQGMTPQRPIWIDGPYRGKTTPEQVKYSRAIYNAEIRYWDDQFKKFTEELQKRGLLDNTVLIVTADHGEEFNEHGGFGHGFTTYEEMMHVPLVMIWPGHIPIETKREDPVCLIDLFPTLAGLAKADLDGMPLQGQDLFADGWLGKKEGFSFWKKSGPRVIYTETYRGKIPRAIRVNDEKLIYDGETKSYEYYNLSTNPHEMKSTYAKDDPHQQALAEELTSLMPRQETPEYPEKLVEAVSLTEGDTAQGKPDATDEEIKEALRSLGYVGN